LIQLNTLKKNKSSQDDINNQNNEINRGIDIILKGGKRKRKPFHVIFDQIIYFFNREIDIYFEFSLNLKKKK